MDTQVHLYIYHLLPPAQINIKPGHWRLTLNRNDPEAYEVAQIHFHWGSEHTVNGKRFPLEVCRYIL